VPNGYDALAYFDTELPDLMVLDIMLPDIDGFEVCSSIREKYPNVFIIILTARSGDMDKIMGLELGADDYMVKPFNPLELAARIRAVLRRSRPVQLEGENKTCCGDLELDIDAQKVFRKGMEVEMTPREFELMKVFMENSGKALSRDELLNLAWGQDFIGDYKTVDVHVRRLREKIEDDSSNPEYIQTVWGLGYRFKG
jgi:DNA-binding response OmpR family regulator